MKSKFGDYTTLNALAEQQRVQGGTFDPRVLMDGSLSKSKIRQHLMIEKVVDRINELEKPHLKLVVMHNFMWALVKEQASDRALANTKIETETPDAIFELWNPKPMTSPRVLLAMPFDLANLWSANMSRTKP